MVVTSPPAVGVEPEVDYTGIDDYNSAEESDEEDCEENLELEEVDVADLQVEEVCDRLMTSSCTMALGILSFSLVTRVVD